MKNYYCNDCAKVFIRKKHLTYHNLNKHTITKRYKSYSGNGLKVKFTTIPLSYNKDINSHRYSNKTIKKCEYCNKIFYYDKALKNHIENTHLRTKILQCLKCQQNVGRLENLKRHEKQCDGNKPTNYTP